MPDGIETELDRAFEEHMNELERMVARPGKQAAGKIRRRLV